MVTARKVSIEESIKKLQNAWNRNNAAALIELYDSDAVVQDPMYSHPLRGRNDIRKDFESFWKAFPDLNFQFSNNLVKGQVGATEVRVTGTHKGPLDGPEGPIAATNNHMEMHVAIFLRFNSQGLVREEHRYYDMAGMMQQLGIGA